MTNQTSFLVAVIGSVLLNGLALFVGRGSFGHWFAALALALYVGGPALLVAAGAYLLRKRFLSARRLARVAATVALVSASVTISLIPGRALAKRDIVAAETRCESLIPGIDEYHRTHGAYPLNFSLISGTGETSRIGQDCAYESDGSEFHFTLGDPRRIVSFISYNSRTRRWFEWD